MGEVQAHARAPAGAGRVGALGERLVRLDLEPTTASRASGGRSSGRTAAGSCSACSSSSCPRTGRARRSSRRTRSTRSRPSGTSPAGLPTPPGGSAFANSSRWSARRTVLAVASTSKTRSPLSSDSQSALSDGTYAEPSMSKARIAGFVPENVDVVKKRLSATLGDAGIGSGPVGPLPYEITSCGGLAPSRLENPTASVLPLVSVKPYWPAAGHRRRHVELDPLTERRVAARAERARRWCRAGCCRWCRSRSTSSSRSGTSVPVVGAGVGDEEPQRRAHARRRERRDGEPHVRLVHDRLVAVAGLVALDARSAVPKFEPAESERTYVSAAGRHRGRAASRRSRSRCGSGCWCRSGSSR